MTVPARFRLGERGPGAATVQRRAWRWEVLDLDLAPIGTVEPVLSSTPQITARVGGTVNRTARGLVLTASDAADIDQARHYLSPVVTVEGVEYRQGVFRVADAVTVDRAPGTWRGQATVEATLADDAVRQQARTFRAVGFTRGLAVETAAQSLATWLSIPRIRVDPVVAEIETPLSWPLGEVEWFEVARRVAKAAGYLDPYFDRDGTWRWRVAPRWETAVPDFAYDTTTTGVAFEGMERSVSNLGEPNVFYAVNASAGSAPVVGRYALPDLAPNSIARIGFEIPEVVESAGLAGTDAADAAARAASAENPAEIGDANLRCVHDPTLDLFALVSVDGWRYRGTGFRLDANHSGVVDQELARLWLTADRPGALMAGLL